MKSNHVYKEITSIIEPNMQSLSFKKLRGSRPKWYREFTDKAIHIYLQTHKYPWEPFVGCSFVIEAYVCPVGTPNNEVESVSSYSVPFIGVEDCTLEEIQKRSEIVISKIKSIDLDQIYKDKENYYDDLDQLKLLHDSAILFIDKEISLSGLRMWRDPWLKYLDMEDVNFWSSFINVRLEENIGRILKLREIT